MFAILVPAYKVRGRQRNGFVRSSVGASARSLVRQKLEVFAEFQTYQVELKFVGEPIMEILMSD